MKLLGTPLSHFTRKVRLLLDHLELDYRFVDVGNVGIANPAFFSNNPLMSVPVLHDGESMLLDSDHIADYIVRLYDPEDRFNVLTTEPNVLNARAVLNGAMAAEVRLVLAERSGLKTIDAPYFDKARLTITNALDWCETRADLFQVSSPTYLAFHLISFWDHMHHYNLVSGNWPALEACTQELSRSTKIKLSAI